MELELPNEDAGSLKEIQAIPKGAIESLISFLEQSPPIADPVAMATSIASKLTDAEVGSLTRILETVYRLYYIREMAGVGPTKFLDDLMEGIEKADTISQEEQARVRSLLDRILAIESLSIVAKAKRLQRDGERLYCKAKILSDIRPVFGRDPSQRPHGVVLAHTMKIAYHEGADHREFHVVLDSDDLVSLGEVIQRAQTKERTIRTLMKSADLGDFLA